MPAIQAPCKVLVSGASGFVASWVVKAFLEAGYSVRGTVRSEAKGEHLKKEFEKYGDKFETIIVADMEKDGAFDEAVKGVDAIEHTASPFHFSADDPNELIGPAVKGTLGILQSALKHAPSVKRITVLSSCAAILRESPTPLVFTESDWNEPAIQQVKELGRNASQPVKYRASKTLAEKAAWDFWKEHQSSVGWDLVALNPPYVFGPAIHPVSSPTSLNTSSLEFYNVVGTGNSHGRSNEALATVGSCWINVQDLARAHVLAAEKEAAGGERIIVSAGPFVWQDWLDAANSLSPSPIPSHMLPRGNPGAGEAATHKIKYDTSKATRILGLEYISREETAREILADIEARKW